MPTVCLYIPCCIIHIAKEFAQRIFIQGSVLVSIGITVDPFLDIKQKFTTHINFFRASQLRGQLVLHLHLDHTVVLIASFISDFQFNHNATLPDITACKRNTLPEYCSMIPTVNRRISPRNIIHTCPFCCPVKINATGHSPRLECDITAIVITPIIKDLCRN